MSLLFHDTHIRCEGCGSLYFKEEESFAIEMNMSGDLKREPAEDKIICTKCSKELVMLDEKGKKKEIRR